MSLTSYQTAPPRDKRENLMWSDEAFGKRAANMSGKIEWAGARPTLNIVTG